MDRKGQLRCAVLSMMLILHSSCRQEYIPDAAETAMISISVDADTFETRADSMEDRIHDLNLLIFENGEVHLSVWKDNFNEGRFEVPLRKGERYSIYAFANLGKKIHVLYHEDLKEEFIEVAAPALSDSGIPMISEKKEIIVRDGMSVNLELTRLAAKVSIRMDRSRLDKDVALKVIRAGIGNCPAFLSLTGVNRIESRFDCIENGHTLYAEDCTPLNTAGKGGLSGEVQLYTWENMQGDFPVPISEDEEKVFDPDDPLAETCTFVELEIEYSSEELTSYDSNLIYRFYLGDGLDNLDVERNCHYSITVCPEGDGLSGGGWRVDKSGIGPSVPYFDMYPAEYIRGHAGDTVRIWCDYYPRTAPFDPGYEELEFDSGRGIYDYTVNIQKKEVTLFLKKAGTGIVYMSAGDPVNASGMAIIEVYP